LSIIKPEEPNPWSAPSAMMHHATADFWKDQRAFPVGIRGRAPKQFALLKANPHHPPLQFKQLTKRGAQEIWSARVTLKYRALAAKDDGDYLFLDWRTRHRRRPRLIPGAILKNRRFRSIPAHSVPARPCRTGFQPVQRRPSGLRWLSLSQVFLSRPSRPTTTLSAPLVRWRAPPPYFFTYFFTSFSFTSAP